MNHRSFAGRAELGHPEDSLRAITLRHQHGRHGGDHVSCLLHHDPVADTEVLADDFLLIMKSGAGDGTTRHEHRIELRHGGQDTAPADLNGDIKEACPSLLRLILVGDRPSGRLACRSEERVLPDPINFDHGTVGLKGEIAADFSDFTDGSHHAGGIACEPVPRINRKAPRF